jgi:hypothetical protein
MRQGALIDHQREKVVPAYGRHETFHPRFGWLKKGLDHATRHPDLFRRVSAPAELGVGKNMVKAIRYWCLAFKILEEVPSRDNTRLKDVQPTDFGTRLLADDGWDPYLERGGSLWLLHWMLLKPPCVAPVWYAALNEFDGLDFTDKELVAAQRSFLSLQDEWPEIADRTLERDVSCFLRMFAGGNKAGDVAEDTIDSPFTALGLIAPIAGEGRHYAFQLGAKPSLEPDIVAFAALDFVVEREIPAATVSIPYLLHAKGGPGRVFSLTESSLLALLVAASERHKQITVTRAGGIAQLVVGGPEERRPNKILSSYFRRDRRRR